MYWFIYISNSMDDYLPPKISCRLFYVNHQAEKETYLRNKKNKK